MKENPVVATEPESFTLRITVNSVEPSDLASAFELPKPRSMKFSRRYGGTSELVTDTGKSIKEYLQGYFKAILERGGEGGPNTFRDKAFVYTREDRLPIPINTSSMKKAYQIKKYWQGLRSRPPVKAHCVARALQLLNANAILNRSATAGKSSVCSLNFIYIHNDSLPNPAETLTSHTGLSALDLLFLDKLMTQAPGISNQEQYKTFVRTMHQYFGRYRDLERTPPTDSLDGVKDRYMPFCEGHGAEDIKITEPGLLGQLRTKARELINRQTSHMGAAMRLLYKLFNKKAIDRGEFELNPRVMVGGTEELNAIAKEAREMLIDYYGDCERTYKEGLMILYTKSPDGSSFDWDTAPKYYTRRASDGKVESDDEKNKNNNGTRKANST